MRSDESASKKRGKKVCRTKSAHLPLKRISNKNEIDMRQVHDCIHCLHWNIEFFQQNFWLQQIKYSDKLRMRLWMKITSEWGTVIDFQKIEGLLLEKVVWYKNLKAYFSRRGWVFKGGDWSYGHWNTINKKTTTTASKINGLHQEKKMNFGYWCVWKQSSWTLTW